MRCDHISVFAVHNGDYIQETVYAGVGPRENLYHSYSVVAYWHQS